MYQDYVVQCTWEGDNTVLTLQAGRYLISCYKDLKTGKIFPQGVNYINRGAELQSLACKSKTIGLDEISEGFDVVRYKILLSLGSKFEDLISRKGLNEESAYDECSIPRFNAAKIHTIGYLFQRFYDSVKKSPKEIQGVLSKLCLLFGLLKVQEQSGKFLQYGYFQSYHMEIIEDQILGLYHELRDQIIPLVDSFNLSDFILNSPFGRYDGDVYRRFFEHVISNNPPKKPAYFETILKPLFEQQQISADRLELEEDEITAKL